MKLLPDLKLEESYENLIVAGVDEAGRGPLAGPVVAACVIVNKDKIISGINDSKKLSSSKRFELFESITAYYAYGIGIVEHTVIDEINILEATKKACILAVENMSTNADVILVDGNMKFHNEKFKSIIKGDAISISIAAASIIAKVTRDRIMTDLAKEFPAYGWEKNFGYGTDKHLKSIRELGLSPWHRTSFKINL